MDSASSESASFNNKTKAKKTHFPPFFHNISPSDITSHHLRAGGRAGLAHTIPEPAGGRGHLVIRHSCFSSPRANGLPQQLSHPAALRKRKPV